MAPTAPTRAKPRVPFSERVTCTYREASDALGPRIRKLKDLVAEGRIKSTKLGNQRLLYVESLLSVLRAGEDAPLVEPEHLKRGREQRATS